jgi:hypothetical protein
MWSGPSRRDQFVADTPREWEVGEGSVQVPKLATADPEFGASKAVLVKAHALPG